MKNKETALQIIEVEEELFKNFNYEFVKEQKIRALSLEACGCVQVTKTHLSSLNKLKLYKVDVKEIQRENREKIQDFESIKVSTYIHYN